MLKNPWTLRDIPR